MTEIEKKALALVNEVLVESGQDTCLSYNKLPFHTAEALCRAIEQHEAFRQEVSDALVEEWGEEYCLEHRRFASFIIAKPDPIAEAWIEATGNTVGMEPLNAALAARGLKIVEDK